MTRTVLGFSGNVRTSAAIPWLIEHHGGEVVTVTLDFGQGEELAAVREQALALGAVRAHVVDVREELVRQYLLPALRAGALMDAHALVRPLLAKRLVEIARMEMAGAIAHCAPAGSDAEMAIESSIHALEPAIEVILPTLASGLSAADLEAFARDHGVHVPPQPAVHVEASVWGRCLTPRGAAPVPADAFTLTRGLSECPPDPALVDVAFIEGVPVAANGVEMSTVELIESLETIAGAHGVGRCVGSDVALETPAARVLMLAYDALESLVLEPDVARLKAQLAGIYSIAIRGGRWFSDMREAIDAFSRVTGMRVSGTVRLALLGGECTVIGCETADAAATTRSSVSRSRAVA